MLSGEIAVIARRSSGVTITNSLLGGGVVPALYRKQEFLLLDGEWLREIWHRDATL